MEKDSLLHGLVECTGTGILVAELGSRRFIFANPAMCELLGYTAAELTSLSVGDIHPPADVAWVVSEFEAQARGEKTIAADVPCLRKDGSVVYADINTAPAVIDGLPCNLGFFNEVTARRDAVEALRQREQQLREANQLLEAILNAIPDLIGVQNPDRTIVRYNEAGYQMLSLTPEEVIGKKCYELIGRDRQCALCATQEALQTGKAAQIIKHVPEVGRWLECRSYPVLDESGNVFRLVEHLRDVTERRTMEEQLRQSEKLQAIGQLAGGVAHDFNNQLSGILGLAEVLEEELKERPELRELTGGILASVERASHLTAQLLAFARRGKYRSETVDVHGLVEEITKLLDRSIDKRIRIERRLAARPCLVLGDPSQLQNALLNLALNARDAMPEGGTLTFETAVVDLEADFCTRHAQQVEPGRYLRICITDTGVGMDAKTQARMFEPFFTTKEKDKGTGMGLAAVYGTVKSHQGVIDVYTEPGRGTTMKLYLPLHSGTQASPAPPEPTPSVSPGGLVLVVDDEPQILSTTCTMLSRLGYQVIPCGNSEDAVSVYQERHTAIDLVILDMVMPNLAGKAVFRALREIDPAVRVVLASGYTLNGEAQEILAQGALQFLQKPFRLAELADVVAKALGKA